MKKLTQNFSSLTLSRKYIFINIRYIHSKYHNVYSELKYVLKNNPINEDTQIKIEKYLLDNAIKDANSDISGLFNGVYSKKTSEFLYNYKPIILEKINNFLLFKPDYEEDNTNKSRYKRQLVEIIEQIGPDYILSVLLGRFIKVLSNSRNDYTQERNFALEVALDLSKDIIRRFLSDKFKLYLNKLIDEKKVVKGEYTFTDWKNEIHNQELFYKLDDSELRASIGVFLIEWLEDCNLITKRLVTIQKKKHNVYQSTDDVLEEWERKIKNEIWTSTENSESLLKQDMILTSSLRLPSIVKPKLYGIENGKHKLGGYLLNDIEYSDPLLLKNHTLDVQSSIHDKNCLYDIINKINSVGYKINSELYKFIITNYKFYSEEILADKHELESKPKLKLWEKKKLQAYISKRELQSHIFSIADLFLDVPEFFFNNRIDYRGRLYCVTEYLNFQSTDLAKSLLLFSTPNKIRKFGDETAIMYLKIYGANCYGNKKNKLSADKKVEWVNENQKRIINYEDGEIILESENKLLFTAFCIEYKKWWKFYYNSTDIFFNTYLPIQLDASCNGFQHLVLLSGETNLRKELNLTQTTYSEAPYDFYSYVLEIYKDYLDNMDLSKLNDKDREGFIRIKEFCLDRKIIKKVIMTIPYNASSKNMVGYIIELLEKDKEWEDDKDKVCYVHTQDISENKKRLYYRDIFLLVNSIKNVLDLIAPKIVKLKSYLKKISYICSYLQLHIPWLLPIGLEVKQSYLKEGSTYIKPFSYSSSRIRLAHYDRTPDKKGLDSDRQVRAFMPNLIHSLDATSLMLLVQKYFINDEFKIKNIYTIHDCFAMPMNHVEFIIDNLRKVYISLYSDSIYLKKLDEGIINHIKNHYRDVNFDIEKNKKRLIILIEGRKEIFDYPDINEVLGGTLPKIDDNTYYILV